MASAPALPQQMSMEALPYSRHSERRRSATRFNLACRIAALLWLVTTIPLGIVLRPTWPDFAQFYMGGLVARHGDWTALYPVPNPTSEDNPGLKPDSTTKPRWDELRRQHGVPDDTRFILPPPAALIFVPLSLVSYKTAFWIWTFVLIGCAWGVALMAGRSYRLLAGHATLWEGILCLLVALSPMVARAIRIENVTPPIALCLGFAVFELIHRNHTARTTLWIFLGAMLKYATLILLPLVIAARKWRVLAGLVVLGLTVTAITWLLAGPAPFVEFFDKIVPTLSRPSDFRGNQSLPGMLARVFGRPLRLKQAIPLHVLRMGSLALAILVIALTPRKHWLRPTTIFAAVCMLLSWLMIFSPITWEHWPIFLCPFWGWILWEARKPGLNRIAAIASIALLYFPAGLMSVRGFFQHRINIPEPFNSSQLLGLAILACFACWHLAAPLLQHRRRPHHTGPLSLSDSALGPG